MGQRTKIQNLIGATMALTATEPATLDAAGYGATAMEYTAIGKVENYGAFGGTKSVENFIDCETGAVDKVPGPKDYGNMALVLGHIPGNAGQALVATAFEGTGRYYAKFSAPLGNNEVTPEIIYLEILVTKNELAGGSAGNVRKRNVEFAICSKPVVVAAT